MPEQFRIQWRDSGREPKCAPNVDYPFGIDVDFSAGAVQRCKAALPYPAQRCGVYIVECRTCGLRAGVTTAGRPDDPRSVTLPCKGPIPEPASALGMRNITAPQEAHGAQRGEEPPSHV